MPRLTMDLGFHDHYVASIAEDLQLVLQSYLTGLETRIASLDCSDDIRQYYIPMGYTMSCQIMGTLPAMVYLAELRSTTYVHPTLRPIAIQIGQYLEKTHGIKMFLDTAADEFDVRRGKHDIEMK